MKESVKYLFILTIFMALSCQKQSIESETIYAEGGLISFSTRIHTKAPIITEFTDEDTFGIFGYSFSNLTNWSTAKAKAVPNEFYQLAVNGNDCSYTYTGEDGIGSRKPWNMSKKYSFFAYYPYNSTAVTTSDATQMGSPYIEYTLPTPTTEGTAVSTSNLIDIMTAKVTDHTIVSGPVVNLNFYHRLFCIDIVAINHNATNVDPIKISDLSVTVSGIHYNKTRIYMDRNELSTSTAENWSVEDEITFSPIIPTNETTNETTNEISINSQSEMSLTGNKNLIMLIPQDSEDAVGLTLTFNFKKNNTWYYAKVDESDPNNPKNIPLSSTFNIKFQEGKKYILTLNLVGDEVTLISGNVEAWKPWEVEHTFE